MKQHVVMSGTAAIYAEEYGEGYPVILLHGNGESISCFKGQIPEFSGRYRVIAIDSRGHGKSTHGEEDLHIYQMSEDVIAVMDKLEIEKAAIVGFSDGGNIAIRCAFMHPERVSALVLTGANTSPHGILWKYLAPMKFESFKLLFRAMHDTEAVRQRELLRLMLKEPNYPMAAVASITAPTLVTAGEDDMIQPAHTEYIARKIKGSKLHIFPGDHFTPVKLPEEYNRVVLEFLGQLDLKA